MFIIFYTQIQSICYTFIQIHVCHMFNNFHANICTEICLYVNIWNWSNFKKASQMVCIYIPYMYTQYIYIWESFLEQCLLFYCHITGSTIHDAVILQAVIVAQIQQNHSFLEQQKFLYLNFIPYNIKNDTFLHKSFKMHENFGCIHDLNNTFVVKMSSFTYFCFSLSS